MWSLRACAVGLILLLQGPAMLTQEVGWARMLVTYTLERGLARGVVETFDGNHPCSMCEMATSLRKDTLGKNPAERRQDDSKRNRLAWAEMVPPHWSGLVPQRGVDVSDEMVLCFFVELGRSREAPLPPPPRMG